MTTDVGAGSAGSVLSQVPTFQAEKHVTYWLRCLKTFLPSYYTSNDANRMTLAFFIVSALDILGCLRSYTSEEERRGYIDWIYHCQHPDGGFRAFPGTDFGELRNESNKIWDPANLPATYFAISLLAIFGDDMNRLKRKECLVWLNKLQRPDGSFGETLGDNGKVEGGQDSRFGFCGTCVRWMLRGQVDGTVNEVPDIRVDDLVSCIRKAETYDGGISEAPFHEAHAGFTNCAINSLANLDRLPQASKQGAQEPANRLTAPSDVPSTIRWLCSRQTGTITPDDALETFGDEAEIPEATRISNSPMLHPVGIIWAGFNGRCSKIADTCYSWWVCSSLATLSRCHSEPDDTRSSGAQQGVKRSLTYLELIDRHAARRFLIDRTQHVVGGFGKAAGDPPDVFHSYLGLTTLGMMGEEGLKEVDSVLCFSKDAKKHIESLPWRREIEERG